MLPILMAWRGTVVAPVLTHWSCCSLALCHQCQCAGCSIHMLPCYHGHIDGLAWNCGSSSADALGLQQSYAVPSVSVRKCLIHMLPCYHGHIDGLAWNCGSSSADTLELLQSCAMPSMSVRKLLCTYVAMLPWSYWWLGVELWWLQCWCTGVAAVLRRAISVSAQVVLYICCHVTMVILMAWRGTVVAPVLTHWSCCSLALCHQCQCAGCSIHMLPCYHGHIDGLAWNCGSSSADALGLQQSYAVPSVSVRKCLIHMLPCYHGHIDGWAWNCGSSNADAMQLLQSCAVPSVLVRKLFYTYVAMLPILMAWRGTVVAPVLTHWSCCSLALCHQCQYASCFIHMLPCYHGHIDGLAWNCGSSSADAMQLLQPCAVPSVSVRKLFYTYVAMLSWLYWWLGVELW